MSSNFDSFQIEFNGLLKCIRPLYFMAFSTTKIGMQFSKSSSLCVCVYVCVLCYTRILNCNDDNNQRLTWCIDKQIRYEIQNIIWMSYLGTTTNNKKNFKTNIEMENERKKAGKRESLMRNTKLLKNMIKSLDSMYMSSTSYM